MGLRGCPQHDPLSNQLHLHPRLQGQCPGAAVLRPAPESLTQQYVSARYRLPSPRPAPRMNREQNGQASALLLLAARRGPAALPVPRGEWLTSTPAFWLATFSYKKCELCIKEISGNSEKQGGRVCPVKETGVGLTKRTLASGLSGCAPHTEPACLLVRLHAGHLCV